MGLIASMIDGQLASRDLEVGTEWLLRGPGG